MMDKEQLRELVTDVITNLGMYSEAAVNLLMGTASVESNLGTFIEQFGGGPARGIMQMEPATEEDIWNNYLRFREILRLDLFKACGRSNPGPWLRYDLAYQIAMARIHYSRVKAALPPPVDETGLGEYWKKHYNTHHGSGTVDKFIDYYQFVR